jgi:FAD/FMN-containing dehydrogenase
MSEFGHTKNRTLEIPRFFGRSNSALLDAGTDYGKVVFNEPSAVVSPSSVSELIDIVKDAKKDKIPIAAVGAGHSLLGQAQALDGIVVNMTNLNQVISIDADSALVEAGASWRELLQATLAEGKTPPVFIDYIDLTIGGTLSVGGIGSQTYRVGLQVDNVLELEVVTGKGKLENCSPTENSDLFYSVLAGHGQFGIITKARIALVPAFENTRYVRTLYSDIDEFTADLFILTQDQRYDGVQGFVVPNKP